MRPGNPAHMVGMGTMHDELPWASGVTSISLYVLGNSQEEDGRIYQNAIE
jgi:hypothetical protein